MSCRLDLPVGTHVDLRRLLLDRIVPSDEVVGFNTLASASIDDIIYFQTA